MKYKGLHFLFCLLVIAVASLTRDGKLLGYNLTPSETDGKALPAVSDSIRTEADGTIVVNTTSMGGNITGYAGTVPVEIRIKDGIVVSVDALPNKETPEFFDEAKTLLGNWKGKSISEARRLKVDAVSGATFSSKAIIANVHRGLDCAAKATTERHWWDETDFSVKAICGIIVALMAAILPLFVRNKPYRIIQQVLNVGVLGFWCGSSLSYAAIIGYMSNGINIATMAAPFILLITAFIYPLFGKNAHYCSHVCPYGSLQELAGRCSKRKLHISPGVVKALNLSRKILFALLMISLWTGAWFSWIDYEPFSAFIIQTASWVVIVIAAAFLLLSFLTLRPYCRFVCPMGTLLKN